ncbi:MAG: hypothetical protein GVY19_09440 [Bacteroidetes bacterium]|jgi:hypothetical protein|nr:hypothetical protein [Bacteroidota bacterium]
MNESIIEQLKQKKIDLRKKYEEDVTSIDRTIQLLSENSNKQEVSLPAVSKPANAAQKTTRRTNTSASRAKKKTTTQNSKSTNKKISENILKIISKARRVMLSTEIFEVLSGAKNLSEQQKSRLRKDISNALYILKSENKIVGIPSKKSKRTYYWGLAEWLDDKGKMKSEFITE